MLNIKLTKSVGRGTYGASEADIRSVQFCLAEIKVNGPRGYRPHYDGRVDGKAGPKTIAVIESFQAHERLPVTGKLEPYGPGIARLKSKTPLSVRPALMSLANLHGQATFKFSRPTGSLSTRQTDRWGAVGFGASRDGGARTHKGTDYVAVPGQDIYAVISGKVTRIGYPYANDLSFRLVDIEDAASGYAVRHFYVQPKSGLSVGSQVQSGDLIDTYQSLASRFPGITEHVHIEIRSGGTLVDPTTVIK